MPNYDFKTLSPHDFEALSRDLLSKELGVELEIFAPGPDEDREAPTPDQLQSPITLKNSDPGWATIRRFGYSERTDAGNRSQHVKLELRPRSTDRHQYRTHYLTIPIAEWKEWQPYAEMLATATVQEQEKP